MANQNQHTEPVYIPLEGMDSEHCALIVDKGWAEVKGLSQHRVELNNCRAVVTAADNDAILEDVTSSNERSGSVPTVKNTIPVPGMSWASCASSTQSPVTRTPGVLDPSVNFPTGNLTAEYIRDITDAKK